MVPLITPALEMERPSGKVPVSSRKLCGATPPVTLSAWENATLWMAVALVGVIDRLGLCTVPL